jgi:hypothetical protein
MHEFLNKIARRHKFLTLTSKFSPRLRKGKNFSSLSSHFALELFTISLEFLTITLKFLTFMLPLAHAGLTKWDLPACPRPARHGIIGPAGVGGGRPDACVLCGRRPNDTVRNLREIVRNSDGK